MSLIKSLLPSVAVLGCLFQTANAAVTFTNTPTAVSNTYIGTITLQIGGLTNTETVVVQKFLDLNTNGVINGSDWLVQQFTLQDGTNFVIGGVTNFNVPGDLNPNPTNITATLNFRNGDFVQNIIGKYLYKLSSPVGHFTPITNQFAVTNFPFPQKFTGNVVSNNTGTTVSNAVVLLFPPPRPGDNGPSGSPLAGVVANNAGSYTVQSPPGTYSLLSFRSNYVVNMNKSPVLTLAASQTITTNLTLTNAAASISGKLVDASNSSIGLPGVMLPAMSANGLIAIAFTDTNGNFNVRVTAGGWGIQADDTTLIVHGYLGLQNGTNVTSGTTGVTLAVPKATALVYGSVKDNLGNPMPGIDVYADDSPNHLYQTDGYTDANGNYVLGLLGGTNYWWMQANSDNQITNYVFTQETIDGNIAVGQAVLQDFTAILATNHITGNVKDSSGTNIVGVNVYAYATVGGMNYNKETDSDANGNYWLNVPNGSWNIGVNCNGSDNSLDNILGNGNYACPNNQNVNIADNNATYNIVVQLCDGISIVTTSPLPVGEVNVYYDQFLQASSCNGNFNWSQTAGSLPNLFLSSNGELAGTPNNSGVFTFTAQVTDQNFLTTNKLLSVIISNAVQITTTSLPNGTNGSAYSQQLQAAAGVPFGGASPYSWSLASGSDSLPADLDLATNGLLSGTLAAGGTFNFTVEVTDSLGATYDQPLSLIVITTEPPPLTVGTGGGQIIVLWPLSAGTNFMLMTTTNLDTGPWVPATNGVPAISILFSNTAPAQFFKLQ